jgi:hypothetical protein
VDGWAHNHRRLDTPLLGDGGLPTFSPPGIPTTLTAWHLPFLAGLLVLAVICGLTAARHRARGRPWSSALPGGWDLVARGLLLTGAGIVARTVIPAPSAISLPELAPGLPRFESLPGLLGPPSLVQAVGVGLVVASPLREQWRRTDPLPSVRAALPTLLSLSFLLAVASYLTQFVHPLVDPWPELSFWRRGLQTYRYGQFYFGESMGVAAILLQTALLMGPVVLVTRRWRLPPGSLTVVFTVHAALVSSLQDRYYFVLAAATAGAAADALAARARPASAELRVLGFAVPALYVGLYFVILEAVTSLQPPLGPATVRLEGIGWSVQLRLGAVLASGLVGLLLTYLVAPDDGRTVGRAGTGDSTADRPGPS